MPAVLKPNWFRPHQSIDEIYHKRVFRAVAYLATVYPSDARSKDITRAAGIISQTHAHLWVDEGLARNWIQRVGRGRYRLHPDILA